MHALPEALRTWSAWREDARRVLEVARRRGASRPSLSAAADPSLWVLTLLRGASLARAVTGSSLGLTHVLRVVFHVDVTSDDIGPGLRLPHPFGLVIGDGARVGAGCTILHNVTIQRGAGTTVGDGAVLGAGATVLGGARVGPRAFVGAGSVVRGDVPAEKVAVGAPARVVRDVRPEEVSP